MLFNMVQSLPVPSPIYARPSSMSPAMVVVSLARLLQGCKLSYIVVVTAWGFSLLLWFSPESRGTCGPPWWTWSPWCWVDHVGGVHNSEGCKSWQIGHLFSLKSNSNFTRKLVLAMLSSNMMGTRINMVDHMSLCIMSKHAISHQELNIVGAYIWT